MEIPVNTSEKPDDIGELSERIKELGGKSAQILTFLGITLFVGIALWSNPLFGRTQKEKLMAAVHWCLRATVPVLLAVIPLKEIRLGSKGWYRFIRWVKIILLWLAAVFIFAGLYDLSQAI
jgi:hypothetical protein